MGKVKLVLGVLLAFRWVPRIWLEMDVTVVKMVKVKGGACHFVLLGISICRIIWHNDIY